MNDEWAILDDVRATAKTAAGAVAFFLAGAIMLAALLLNGIYFWAGWLIALLFLLVGGGLLLQFVPRVLRRRTPFLVITPAGFRCPGVVEPLLPWSSIERARVSDDAVVCTDFFFKKNAALPVRDRSRANVQLSRRLHMLSIRGPVPLGMSLEDYGRRIGAVMEAARERERDGAAP